MSVEISRCASMAARFRGRFFSVQETRKERLSGDFPQSLFAKELKTLSVCELRIAIVWTRGAWKRKGKREVGAIVKKFFMDGEVGCGAGLCALNRWWGVLDYGPPYII